MAQLDQEVRQWVSGSLEGQPDSATVARMISVDAAHTERLKKIIELYGWPDYSLVGEDGVGAAFLILQHSPDRSFQERIPFPRAFPRKL